MYKTINQSLLLLVFSFSLSSYIKAQDYLNYHDFIFSNVNLEEIHGNITWEERNHYLSLTDSFPIYDQAYRAEMEKYPDSLMQAVYHAGNVSVLSQIYLVAYEYEEALRYMGEYAMLCEKYKEQYKSQIDDYRYDEFNAGIIGSYIFKGIIHIMAGEIEASSYNIKKAEQLMNDYALSNKWKMMIAPNIYYLKTNLGMANRECYSSHKNADKLIELYDNPVKKEKAGKDHLKLRTYNDNRYNAIQHKILAISCTCDSLLAKGKENIAREFVKENKNYFESFRDVFRDVKKQNGKEVSGKSVTTFLTYYYSMINDIKQGKKVFQNNDVDDYSGLEKVYWYRDYAGFYLDHDLEKANYNLLKAEEELDVLFSFGESIQSFRHQITSLGIQTLKAMVAEVKYSKYNDQKELIKSHRLFKELYEKSIRLRETQTNDLSAIYTETELKDLYDQAAMNAYLCYKEFGDLSYLYDCIKYAENSKSFLLRKNNTQIMNEQFRNSEDYQKVFLEERQLSNRLSFFQGQVDNLVDDKALLDSVFVYREAKKIFNNKVIKEYPEYYKWKQGNINLDIKKIQENLGKGIAIFSYMENPKMSLLNLITHDDIKTFALDSMEYWIDDLLAYNQTIREGGMKKYKKLGSRIYDVLLKKGIDELSDSITRIIIIPDGEINELNIGSLPFPNTEGSQYLIEKYAVSYQYSLEMLQLDKGKKEEGLTYDFMAFIPEYKGGLGDKMRCADSPLTYAKESVMVCNNLFNKSKAFENALVQDVVQNASNTKILHFSAHGCVSNVKTPLHYNLLMTLDKGNKSELSVVDIYDLKLKSDLTVLAACESGRGQLRDGVGVYSIAWAFHYAGCPNTIATTAVVDEESTSQILLYFYEFLYMGNPLDVALQKAQLAYIEKKEAVEPYIWSNIILIGNPTKIHLN